MAEDQDRRETDDAADPGDQEIVGRADGEDEQFDEEDDTDADAELDEDVEEK